MHRKYSKIAISNSLEKKNLSSIWQYIPNVSSSEEQLQATLKKERDGSSSSWYEVNLIAFYIFIAPKKVLTLPSKLAGKHVS